MPPLTRIICLANSWKHGDTCIAGIEPSTGKWIRPVSDFDDGRILRNIRMVEGREPELLDILDIPLAETGSDFGLASENRSLVPGAWRLAGRRQPADVFKYFGNMRYILHNSWKYVTVPSLQGLPFSQRQTLQLVYAVEFYVRSAERSRGSKQWKGTLVTARGQRLTDAGITDPVFVEKLEAGYRPQNSCLVTVSLSMPHRPPDWEGDDPYWKLIAGVTELDERSQMPDDSYF